METEERGGGGRCGSMYTSFSVIQQRGEGIFICMNNNPADCQADNELVYQSDWDP